MKWYRFYEELKKKNRKGEESKHTVIALMLKDDGTPLYAPRRRSQELCAECISSIFNQPNGPVAGSAVAMVYLWESCRRISEDRAREIHPKLFEYLEG